MFFYFLKSRKRLQLQWHFASTFWEICINTFGNVQLNFSGLQKHNFQNRITVGEVDLLEALTSPGKVCGRGLLDLDLVPDPESGWRLRLILSPEAPWTCWAEDVASLSLVSSDISTCLNLRNWAAGSGGICSFRGVKTAEISVWVKQSQDLDMANPEVLSLLTSWIFLCCTWVVWMGSDMGPTDWVIWKKETDEDSLELCRCRELGGSWKLDINCMTPMRLDCSCSTWLWRLLQVLLKASTAVISYKKKNVNMSKITTRAKNS